MLLPKLQHSLIWTALLSSSWFLSWTERKNTPQAVAPGLRVGIFRSWQACGIGKGGALTVKSCNAETRACKQQLWRTWLWLCGQLGEFVSELREQRVGLCLRSLHYALQMLQGRPMEVVSGYVHARQTCGVVRGHYIMLSTRQTRGVVSGYIHARQTCGVDSGHCIVLSTRRTRGVVGGMSISTCRTYQVLAKRYLFFFLFKIFWGAGEI